MFADQYPRQSASYSSFVRGSTERQLQVERPIAMSRSGSAGALPFRHLLRLFRL